METFAQQSNPVPAPPKIGKFAASYKIVQESWALLKQDREIIWFPLISSIVSLLALAGIAAIYFFTILHGNINNIENINNDTKPAIVDYVFLFFYYLILFFIMNFFQAAIMVIAYARFHNEDLNFNDGLRVASENMGKILGWSIISATVGVILRIIADKFKLAGVIVSTILGAAWNILTYFSLPALIIGKTSIRDSFRESAQVIRKTWGETIIIQLGVGLYFAALVIIATIVGVVLVATFPKTSVFFSVVSLYVLFIVIIVMISSALSTIFKLALYEYAKTGVIPSGFSPELVQNAIKVK